MNDFALIKESQTMPICHQEEPTELVLYKGWKNNSGSQANEESFAVILMLSPICFTKGWWESDHTNLIVVIVIIPDSFYLFYGTLMVWWENGGLCCHTHPGSNVVICEVCDLRQLIWASDFPPWNRDNIFSRLSHGLWDRYTFHQHVSFPSLSFSPPHQPSPTKELFVFAGSLHSFPSSLLMRI